MKPQTEKHLTDQLNKIEHMADLIKAQRGYSRETRALKMLAELMKEQVPHAHSSPAIRQIR